jgi:TP901 family phage tail tape measure protein
MSAEVADLYIVLRSVTDPFSKGLKTAAADAESQSKRMTSALASVAKVGAGVTLAVAGIAVASVKTASEFQVQMTRLYTAAGAPKAAVQAASGEILKLGTQVGMTGTAMAEALYHPVSAGLNLATSLQVVKYAAEEAQISGASLDNTTYSLSSVMKAFNEPASQAAQTMADLNAIVGQGDTHFQDFNVSIKNWAPTAAAMGISITSIGSAIGYLTDRGNSAEEASTRLTMGLSMMATPSKQAASLLEGLGVASSDVKGSTAAMTEVLKKSGITQNQLALDLQKPDGIYVALTHLKTALNDAGVKGTEADSAIAKIFGGGRSDKAILSLMQDLGGLQDKFNKVTADSTTAKFNQDWTDTKTNFSFLMEQMKVAAENFGISLGSKLLPKLSEAITAGESGLGQIVSGFSGSATQPVAHDNQHNAFLNQEAATPPPLTGWQKFGEETHRVLTDLERDAVKLKPVAMDFVHFGEDAFAAGQKLVIALEPAAKLLGQGLLLAVVGVGNALADVAGPALKDFADFLAAHQGLIEFFAVTVLGGLILKMTVLSSIKAAQGVIGLATSIAGFPLGQAGQIKTAFDGLKTAWSGKEAVEGEKAVTGLKGAITELKGAATGVLDKFPLFDSGKLAGLARAGEDIKKVETAAADSTQLGLFETNLKGIVQVADTEQLSLFETDIAGVGAKTEASAVSAEKLSGKLGKFALAGGMAAALVGVGLLADQLGQLMGVGDHTALSMDKLTTELNLSGAGSSAARTQFTQTAVSMVAMSVAMGSMGMKSQGLKDVDTSLTNLVSSGHAQEAKAQFDDIAAALQKQGIDAQTAASKFPGYEQALKDAGNAADTMDGKVQTALDTLQKQQALDQFQSDLSGLSEQLKSTGNALTGNSQNAIANRQAFAGAAQEALDFYQQQRNANVPMAQATADLQRQYTALENVATAALGSKDAADKFLATLGLIKPQYATTLKVWVDTSQLAIAQGMVSNLGSGSHHAVATFGDGGFVSGARGAPQLILAHGGEFVVSNDMQSGSQHIDPRALGGMSGGSGRSVGGVMGGTSVVNNYYVTNVAGSVTTEKKLADVVRTQVLQYKGRNSTSGLG